jgi:hypothetical protein
VILVLINPKVPAGAQAVSMMHLLTKLRPASASARVLFLLIEIRKQAEKWSGATFSPISEVTHFSCA